MLKNTLTSLDKVIALMNAHSRVVEGIAETVSQEEAEALLVVSLGLGVVKENLKAVQLTISEALGDPSYD